MSPGALTDIAGFDPQLIKYCTMHTLNLGVDTFAAGSCLQTLLNNGMWGGNAVSLQERLCQAWCAFNEWAKGRRITKLCCITVAQNISLNVCKHMVAQLILRHSQPVFSKNVLGGDPAAYPVLHAKAYNDTCMI